MERNLMLYMTVFKYLFICSAKSGPTLEEGIALN